MSEIFLKSNAQKVAIAYSRYKVHPCLNNHVKLINSLDEFVRGFDNLSDLVDSGFANQVLGRQS